MLQATFNSTGTSDARCLKVRRATGRRSREAERGRPQSGRTVDRCHALRPACLAPPLALSPLTRPPVLSVCLSVMCGRCGTGMAPASGPCAASGPTPRRAGGTPSPASSSSLRAFERRGRPAYKVAGRGAGRRGGRWRKEEEGGEEGRRGGSLYIGVNVDIRCNLLAGAYRGGDTADGCGGGGPRWWAGRWMRLGAPVLQEEKRLRDVRVPNRDDVSEPLGEVAPLAEGGRVERGDMKRRGWDGAQKRRWGKCGGGVRPCRGSTHNCAREPR